MKKTLILLLSIFIGIGALAQEKEAVFKDGERLLFMVSYRAKLWPNTDMGTVEMRVDEECLDNEMMHKITAYATVLGEYRWFYKLDDYYYSWVDKTTSKPAMSKSEISEGSYRFSSKYEYNWEEMSVKTNYRKHSWVKNRHREMTLESGTMDGLSLFFNLRNEDLQSYKPGEEHTLSLLSSDTIRDIKYKFIKRENKNIRGLGKIKTLKFSCSMATLSEEMDKKGEPFYVWITDDANKVPVLFESAVVIGSVRVRLVDYKNLKYPKQSVLK